MEHLWHLALIVAVGPVILAAPFVMAYVLVQRPADEAARVARARAAVERETQLRRAALPRRKELAR